MAEPAAGNSETAIAPHRSSLIGGTAGIAPARAGTALKVVSGKNGNGAHAASRKNGQPGTNGHARPRLATTTRRAQFRRATIIVTLFVTFVVKAMWWRRRAADIDVALRQEAVALRKIFEQLGGTFIKLAQQASIRRDVLPDAYCDELANLQDGALAISVEHLNRLVEEQTGRPVAEVFASIDPSPIGSASIGCVFRAVRIDGREVAIKIRRPGIEAVFALDLAMMDSVVDLVELIGLPSHGMTKAMVTELRHVLGEELNFPQEIRYQGLFRQNFRRWKKVRITAPRVHRDLCGRDIIVTDYVSGIRLKDLLLNLQSGDEGYAAYLAELGIDHRDIGRRLVRGQHFQVHECPFFHADPHPGNIILKPGGQIVFLDFGACGVLSERDRNLVLEMNRRFGEGDVVGMVQCVTGIMEPLPRIDTETFTADLEREWWQGYYGIIDKHALWHERTSFRLWTALLTTLRQSQIELPTRMLKLVRATLLYDTVAAQLDDKINVFAEFDKYAHAAVKRQRRLLKRALLRQAIKGPDDWLWQRYNQIEKLGSRVLFVAEKLLNEQTPRLDASFNVVGGVVSQLGVVIVTTAQLALGFSLAFYSYVRYLRVYEPAKWVRGIDVLTLPIQLFESARNGSKSDILLLCVLGIGIGFAAIKSAKVYRDLAALFGQKN